MEKPRGFIHWEQDEDYYYSLGFMVFGRVAIPVYLFLVIGGVLQVIGVLSGVVVAELMDMGRGDTPPWWFIFFLTPIILAAPVAAVVGVTSLVRFISDEIEIRGPRRGGK